MLRIGEYFVSFLYFLELLLVAGWSIRVILFRQRFIGCFNRTDLGLGRNFEYFVELLVVYIVIL